MVAVRFFSVAGFMATPSAGGFLVANRLGMMRCRSLLVLVFAFQAADRNGGLNRIINS